MPRYIRITINGSLQFLFIPQSTNDSQTRSLLEYELPYLRDKILYDQISTNGDIQFNGIVKTGSSYPYATNLAARTARNACLTTNQITSFTIEDGDWNGSSFSANAAYTWNLPDAGKSAQIRQFNINEAQNINELTVQLIITQGGQF